MPAVLRLHAERTRNRTDLDIGTSCAGTWTVRERESASVCFLGFKTSPRGVETACGKHCSVAVQRVTVVRPKRSPGRVAAGRAQPALYIATRYSGGCAPAASVLTDKPCTTRFKLLTDILRIRQTRLCDDARDVSWVIARVPDHKGAIIQIRRIITHHFAQRHPAGSKGSPHPPFRGAPTEADAPRRPHRAIRATPPIGAAGADPSVAAGKWTPRVPRWERKRAGAAETRSARRRCGGRRVRPGHVPRLSASLSSVHVGDWVGHRPTIGHYRGPCPLDSSLYPGQDGGRRRSRLTVGRRRVKRPRHGCPPGS